MAVPKSIDNLNFTVFFCGVLVPNWVLTTAVVSVSLQFWVLSLNWLQTFSALIYELLSWCEHGKWSFSGTQESSDTISLSSQSARANFIILLVLSNASPIIPATFKLGRGGGTMTMMDDNDNENDNNNNKNITG